MNLTQSLREEYARLFDTCDIRPDRAAEIERLAGRVASAASRYGSVAGETGVPWYVIAAIHAMECNLDFGLHLHNGDPLAARTRRVPAGRPLAGSPPFTWEESAADALRFDKIDLWRDWSVAGTLYKLEGYNGWGYRRHHPEVKSPYLWSFSNHYTRGKYVADGTWSATAVSRQCGAAVLLRRLAEKNLIEFGTREPIEPPASGEEIDAEPLIHFWNGGREVPHARALQRFLNEMPGVFVKVDGKPGEKTSNAVKRVLGHYLPGDPRGL
jgi:lysozyme family protein